MAKQTRCASMVAGVLALASIVGLSFPSAAVADGSHGGAKRPPKFEVDASWPKTLPNNWVIGQTGGIAVDSRDHIWLLQRPRSIAERYLGPSLTPPRSTCCVAALSGRQRVTRSLLRCAASRLRCCLALRSRWLCIPGSVDAAWCAPDCSNPGVDTFLWKVS